MNCPECNQEMAPRRTTTGIDLETCPGCASLWFDKGEIFSFATSPQNMGRALAEARTRSLQTKYVSPVSGEKMVAIKFETGPGCLDLASGGVWLRGVSVRSMIAKKILKLYAAKQADPNQPLRRAPPKPVVLPKLWLRSAVTLVGLYAVLSLVLITASLFAGLPPAFALLVAVLFAAIQFLISPFLMDFMLRWLYQVQWIEYSELPEHLAAFVHKTCAKQKMKAPRLGLIFDLSPNAFTYGHTPNNARLVLTQGTIELLEPKELEAVAGHELGHARNWDMALMTLAQLVPMVLYYLYRWAIRLDPDDNRAKAASTAVAVGAYLLYILSEYIVLWFSRTREYYADRFGAEAVGSPRAMASALVKIAYGLAGAGAEVAGNTGERRAATLGALGIFDAGAAQSFALTSYGAGHDTSSSDGGSEKYRIDSESILGAMKWDLWNPWALWYEIHSTHPLTAKRIQHLSLLSATLNEEPLVDFALRQPESYWDEFWVDVSVNFLPTLIFVIGSLSIFAGMLFDANAGFALPAEFGAVLFLTGLAMLLKLGFRYPSGRFADTSVRTLLQEVKVSSVRPVPCRLEGVIRGRGVPGLIYSDDFTLQDDTGIIFLDHRQPLALWEVIFGWLRAKDLVGEHVVVEGWYRRAPMPYVEISRYEINGVTRHSWMRLVMRVVALCVTVFGVLLWLGAIG